MTKKILYKDRERLYLFIILYVFITLLKNYNENMK